MKCKKIDVQIAQSHHEVQIDRIGDDLVHEAQGGARIPGLVVLLVPLDDADGASVTGTCHLDLQAAR